MAHNDAIIVLFGERTKLVFERDAMLEKLNAQISGIESSIAILSGSKVWEISQTELFDDSNPDYIKGSIED